MVLRTRHLCSIQSCCYGNSRTYMTLWVRSLPGKCGGKRKGHILYSQITSEIGSTNVASRKQHLTSLGSLWTLEVMKFAHQCRDDLTKKFSRRIKFGAENKRNSWRVWCFTELWVLDQCLLMTWISFNIRSALTCVSSLTIEAHWVGCFAKLERYIRVYKMGVVNKSMYGLDPLNHVFWVGCRFFKTVANYWPLSILVLSIPYLMLSQASLV